MLDQVMHHPRGKHMEINELRDSVERALDMVHANRTILAAEVCASWCEQQVVRIQHDADHPGEALQALESQTVYGLSVLLVMSDGTGCATGFGVTDADLSQDGIVMALEMAQHSMAPEPFFLSLPRPVDLAPPPT